MAKNKRKMITITLALLILLLGIIATTTAYIIRESEDVTNRFTYASTESSIAAILTEPAWDDEEQEKAKQLIPGSKILKDPMITNTGHISDIWVAAKVTFVYNEGHERAGQPLSAADYVKLMDVLTIDWNMTDWDLVEEETPHLIFRYRTALAKDADEDTDGASTEPLFTTVTVSGSASNDQINALNEMKGFCIYVEGFAAQAQSGDSYEDFRSVDIYFENTPTAENPVVF